MKKIDQNLENRIIDILKKHEVKKAAIFGSYSWGQARKDSDIDILVELPETKDLLDLVAIKLDLEENLNKNVDISTYDGLNSKIKDEILKEQKVLI